MPNVRTVFTSILVLYVAYRFSERKSARVLDRTPVVHISNGGVQGVIEKSRGGRNFFAFYGIPYAKPPIGELRFERSQPADPWTDVLDAAEYGPQCAQNNFKTDGGVIGDEDCLTANVFIPQNAEDSNKSVKKTDVVLMPVMVYIHGGGFVMDGSPLYAPDYFMDEDIILVTFNYRLSSLGFLNSADGLIRGNQGISDQILALKFVQKNIKQFNGDPNQVTIFGESAGAASCHIHLLSPSTKGLFHKAIIQSGVATSPWAILKDPQKQYHTIVNSLGCLDENPKNIVDCLKKKDFRDLVSLFADITDPIKEQTTYFLPTIDVIYDEHTILPADPMELLKRGAFHKVPIIFGFNSDEGLMTAPMVLHNSNTRKMNWLDLAPDLLMYPKNDDLSKKLFEFYFRNEDKNFNYIDSKEKRLENYSNLLTDRMFLVPLHKSAIQHNSFDGDHPVYLYMYAYHGEFSLAKLIDLILGITPYPKINFILNSFLEWFRISVLGGPPKEYGVCHADDLASLFRGFQMPPDYPTIGVDSKDYKFSREFVKTWTKFAQGVPLDFMNVTWQPMPKNFSDPFSIQYFKIDIESPGMLYGSFLRRIKFAYDLF